LPLRRRRNLFSLIIITTLGLILLNWTAVLRWFYPIRYIDEISAHTEATSLDPYLIAALIRVESNFRPDVRSPKGATGLMQLMPETARWVAGQLRLGPDEVDLLDPDVNIRLGTCYLTMLQKDFDDNLVVALAAYNGGRGNVSRWLAEGRWNGQLDDVRNIPFLETRLYVQRVLAVHAWYIRIYRGMWPPPSTELPVLPDIGHQVESWWHRTRQLLDGRLPLPRPDI
jgi:soluble lytic murein transglycosylase